MFTSIKGLQTPRTHAYPQGSQPPTTINYTQHASYNPGHHHSYQPVMQSMTNVASNWSSTSSQHQRHVVPKCRVCHKDAYYDTQLMQYFEYCSGDCRDKDLLAINVRDTKKDIETLEQSVKQGHADLALPKTKSGGKVNCRKCDSFSLGSAIKGICSSGICAAKNERMTPPTTTNRKTSQTSSDASRRSKEGGTSRDLRSTQTTVKIKVPKREYENLGLFLSSSSSPGIQGCIVTGYRLQSPIDSLIHQGELHLLDAVVKVNGVDIKNYMDLDRRVRGCASVDLTCSIQKEHHVDSVREFNVPPTEVTHIFALRCSQRDKLFGIEVPRYSNSINKVHTRSLAEESGLKIYDKIIMFAVMVAPGQMKSLEKFAHYATTEFSAKLNEAIKEVTSSLSTILLFIKRIIQ